MNGIDMVKTLGIKDTKNRQSHALPLSDYLVKLFENRKADSDNNSPFVFPGTRKTGYNIEPRKVMNKIIGQSGVTFTLHDLRRTFITVAESLEFPPMLLKTTIDTSLTL